MKPLAGIVAASLLLGACQAPPPPTRTVSLLHYFTGNLKSGVAELAEAINKEGKNLELVPTPLEHEEFKTLIRLQLDGPTPPDLFSYWAGSKTGSLVALHQVASLEDLWARSIPPGTFPESVTEAVSYGGKPYLLPLTRHYVGFFFNTAVFRQAGIRPPETWNELMAAAKALADRKVVPFALGGKSRWPLQFWFDYLLLRDPGFGFRQQLAAGTASWKSPEVTRAFGRWKALADAHWFNADWPDLEWDQAALQVLEGRAAMTLMGTWAIGLFNDKKAQYPGDYGFFVFPTVEAGVEEAALGPIDGIVMSSRPRSGEDSLAILARLADPQVQAAFNVAAGAIAPNRKVPDEAYPPLQRQIKTLIEAAPRWAFNFDLAFDAATAETGLDGFVRFLRNPESLSSTLDALETQRLSKPPRP